MVRSMIAGVAGLRAHQSKMDVIGNNIANVNTWGFKGYSYNFKDSMYTNSISSTGGSLLAGASGGRNASQVGYGSQLSSISNVFETGAPSPSSRDMDCMIDGTGFFLVGNMVNGSFTNVKDSGLYLSRVGIFSVDENGYLVDDQRSYVYGYAVEKDTGIPEKPAQQAQATLNGVTLDYTQDPVSKNYSISVNGSTPVETSVKDIRAEIDKALDEWSKGAAEDATFSEGCLISVDQILDNDFANGKVTINVTIKAQKPGELSDDGQTKFDDIVSGVVAKFGTPTGNIDTVNGKDMVYGVPAQYSSSLSTLSIPMDPDTKQPYELTSYKINEDGTVTGVDKQNRVIVMGKVALIAVQNPNGLEKTNGYYYTIGDNAGEITHELPSTGPTGYIKGSYLEMANVDLANEFSNIITTQRGFQANSKIITVTDEMLQELVSMKR